MTYSSVQHSTWAHQGVDVVFQRSLNKLMHCYNGNIPHVLHFTMEGSSIKPKVTLSLDEAIPNSETEVTYSRSQLLQFRPPRGLQQHIHMTTPPIYLLPADPPKPKHRSGNRKKIRMTDGRIVFWKSAKQNSGIHSNSTQTFGQAPPPSGTPGSQRDNEECSPPTPRATASKRGSRRRCRRKLYRAWRQGCRQDKGKGLGPPPWPQRIPKKPLTQELGGSDR